MTALWFIRFVMLLMFVLPGVLSVWVGISGSRWFFDSRGTGFWRRKLGLRGARIMYVVLGLLLLGCGVVFMLDPLGLMSEMEMR